jgi:hypothetical protein
MSQTYLRRALSQSWHVWPWVTIYVTTKHVLPLRLTLRMKRICA